MLVLDFRNQAVVCVKSTLSTSVTFTMSSVATKLTQYREGQKKIESKDEMGRIQAMTLEQLAKERIAFGKAKMGQTFPEVFEDHSCMDRLVHPSIREEPEASAPDVCPVRSEALGSRDCPGHDQEPDQEIREDEGVPSHRLSRLRCVGSDLRTGSSGELLRNASPSQDSTGGGTGGQSLYGEQAVGKSHHEHGDGHAGGPHACTSTECENRAVEIACSADVHMHDRTVDLDFDFSPSQEHNSFKARIQRDVSKFSKELHDIVVQVRSKPRCQQPRLDLLEVMCSGESELTKQMQRLGGKAQRFWSFARRSQYSRRP